MGSRPVYVVVGKGRWAHRMHSVLSNEGRRVVDVQRSRAGGGEDRARYVERLAASLAETGGDVAWICLPPAAPVPDVVEAALLAGLHVVVEKPWSRAADVTERLRALADDAGRVVGVHFEYCLLDGVEAWRREHGAGAGLTFGGRFAVPGGDRWDVPAVDNLGCHLVAIREHAVPRAVLGELDCAYEAAPGRQVWLDRGNQRVGTIDFTANDEPIIQRFVDLFEKALDGDAFPFGLAFAGRVAESLRRYRSR